MLDETGNIETAVAAIRDRIADGIRGVHAAFIALKDFEEGGERKTALVYQIRTFETYVDLATYLQQPPGRVPKLKFAADAETWEIALKMGEDRCLDYLEGIAGGGPPVILGTSWQETILGRAPAEGEA